jgi:uracil-DNA glycosylase family protein
MSGEMRDAAAYVPATRTMAALRAAVQDCRGCALYRNATQAVLGEIEGASKRRSHAKIMLIGEQPGDKEDLAGRPFVGPAGKLLDECLLQAGIDRSEVYVTNTVKHFKWEPRGKVRLHKRPSLAEIRACRPWLDAEVDLVRPHLIVCLGAVAAQGLLGTRFRVTASHGKEQHQEGYPPIIATAHPASILRAVSKEDRHKLTEQLISDLKWGGPQN